MFNIGCTYRSPEYHICLAISKELVIFYKKGRLHQRKPRRKYKLHHISLSDLCDKWGISIARLDELGRQFMPLPPPHRKRDAKRPKAVGDDDYKQLRLVRIFRNG